MAQFPSIGALKSDGGPVGESAFGVGVTVAGSNSYIAGTFGTAAKIAGTELSNTSGFSNVFVAQYSPAGVAFWAKAPVITGPLGNVRLSGGMWSPLLAGSFWGTSMTFESQVLTNCAGENGGTADIFLACYEPWGNISWVRRWGGTGNEAVEDVAYYPNGYYLTGWFQSPVFDAGSTNLALLGTNQVDAYVIKCGANGNVLWARQGSNAKGKLIALDNSNNTYIAGEALGEVVFDGLSPTNQTSSQFLVKLNGAGVPIWIRGDIAIGSALAVDQGQNIFTAGVFSNAMQLGGIELSTENPATIYLAKFDSGGQVAWARQIPGLGCDRVTSIMTDFKSNCWVAGAMSLPGDSSEHAFVACYSATGSLIGLGRADGSGSSVFTDMDTFIGYGTYLSGTFSSNMAIGDHVLTNSGNQDVVFCRVNVVPPALDTSLSGDNSLILSWPARNDGYSDVVLQTTTDMNSDNWTTVTNAKTILGGWNYVTNSSSSNSAFFRILLQPNPY